MVFIYELNSSFYSFWFNFYFEKGFVFNSDSDSEMNVSYLAGYKFGLRIAFAIKYHDSLKVFNSIFPFGAQIRVENGSFKR